MNTIPTAETIIKSQFVEGEYDEIMDRLNISSSITTAMIAFAKLHVKAALEAAANNAKMELICDTPETEYIDRDSILNIYPLINIK